MRQLLSSLVEIAEVVVIALAAVFLVRTFLFQPFLVSGASMETNFSNGDYILVDELTYRIRPPERGEVIVFRYPKDESTYFIKRVIGLPGESVEIAKNKVTVYDAAHPGGGVLHEDYLPAGTPVQACASGDGMAEQKFTLGQDEYFVMGDNRTASFDSRCWGPVKKNEIMGVARVRLWPVTKPMEILTPAYQ